MHIVIQVAADQRRARAARQADRLQHAHDLNDLILDAERLRERIDRKNLTATSEPMTATGRLSSPCPPR